MEQPAEHSGLVTCTKVELPYPVTDPTTWLGSNLLSSHFLRRYVLYIWPMQLTVEITFMPIQVPASCCDASPRAHGTQISPSLMFSLKVSFRSTGEPKLRYTDSGHNGMHLLRCVSRTRIQYCDGGIFICTS